MTATVTRLRPAPRDRNGDPTGPDSETPVTLLAHWPSDGNGSGGNERDDRQNTVVTGYTLMLDPDADVRASDRWRYRDVLWEQIGEPARYDNDLPPVPVRVLTVTLKRVTG